MWTAIKIFLLSCTANEIMLNWPLPYPIVNLFCFVVFLFKGKKKK